MTQSLWLNYPEWNTGQDPGGRRLSRKETSIWFLSRELQPTFQKLEHFHAKKETFKVMFQAGICRRKHKFLEEDRPRFEVRRTTLASFSTTKPPFLYSREEAEPVTLPAGLRSDTQASGSVCSPQVPNPWPWWLTSLLFSCYYYLLSLLEKLGCLRRKHRAHDWVHSLISSSLL